MFYLCLHTQLLNQSDNILEDYRAKMTIVFPEELVIARWGEEEEVDATIGSGGEGSATGKDTTAPEKPPKAIKIEKNTEFSIERKKKYDSDNDNQEIYKVEVGCSFTLNVSSKSKNLNLY